MPRSNDLFDSAPALIASEKTNEQSAQSEAGSQFISEWFAEHGLAYGRKPIGSTVGALPSSLSPSDNVRANIESCLDVAC